MAYAIRTRDEHFANDGSPKRILALDGGGLRGILTLGILQRIEDILRARHGGSADFRLAHYYDLIAGTSTGAIIAATLALGWSVEEIRAKYMQLGERVFERSFLRQGLFRAKYDERKLIEELKNVFGESTTLGDRKLITGLLVVTKRIDTGSPWPLGNNPKGKYFEPRPGHVIGNGDYPLWKVVRASTAAPAYFDPERITICQPPDGKNVVGDFVDGGVSPHNNPSLMALMYATLKGFRVGWPMGAGKILLTSVGTGAADPNVEQSSIAAQQALKALLSLMQDAATLNETLLQWLSDGPTHRKIDSEIESLDEDSVGGEARLTYSRYNVDLQFASVHALNPDLKDADEVAELSAMDAPENMKTLHGLGMAAGKRDVKDAHFPASFDLR
jgi:hypothetical protein